MDDQTLKQLASQKEKEWIAVLQERFSLLLSFRKRPMIDSRLTALEATVEGKDQQLAETTQKYARLSDDFKYNLKLIDDRDKELATFDTRFKGLRSPTNDGLTRRHASRTLEMKKVLNEKNSEISELKIVNDQLYTLKKQIEVQIDEEKKHFLHRLSIKEKDLGNYKQHCDQILQSEREQLEQERRTINRRLTELENDLERQRRELTQEFETQTRKLELDWKRRHDDLLNTQLASELKVSDSSIVFLSMHNNNNGLIQSKLLMEELEQHGQTRRDDESNNAELVERNKASEKRVKELEWQLREQEAVKNAR